jgi:hypothetical protein
MKKRRYPLPAGRPPGVTGEKELFTGLTAPHMAGKVQYMESDHPSGKILPIDGLAQRLKPMNRRNHPNRE